MFVKWNNQQALNCTKPEEMRKLKNKNKNLEKVVPIEILN